MGGFTQSLPLNGAGRNNCPPCSRGCQGLVLIADWATILVTEDVLKPIGPIGSSYLAHVAFRCDISGSQSRAM